MTQPRALIIAGPNGAGKTTFAREFLVGEAHCPTFINADLIAAGISPFQPEAVAAKAMRLMAEEMHARVERSEDFAIESTLAGRTYGRNIADWKTRGYHVKIVFLRLPSVDIAIRRVRQRVAQGGHNVSEPIIRRRYDRGWTNFEQTYRNLADSWQLYDASRWPPVFVDDGGTP